MSLEATREGLKDLGSVLKPLDLIPKVRKGGEHRTGFWLRRLLPPGAAKAAWRQEDPLETVIIIQEREKVSREEREGPLGSEVFLPGRGGQLSLRVQERAPSEATS